MPRDQAELSPSQAFETSKDAPAAAGAEGDALNNAALVAVARDLPTARDTWEKNTRKLVGGQLYERIMAHTSADDFMRYGKTALDRGISQISGALRDALLKGTLEQRENAVMLSESLRATLAPIAAAFMSTGPGASLAKTLADHIEGDPAAVILTMLLVAAVAVLSDQPIPELRKSFHLGRRVSVNLSAHLGSFRHMMVESLGAEVAYAGEGLTAKAGYERLGGKRAEDALAGINPQYVGGGLDNHGTVDRLSADLAMQIKALQNGSLHASGEAILRNGQMLRGRVGAEVGFDAAPNLHVSGGAAVEQKVGEAMTGSASVAASYTPSKHEAYTVGITQGLGPNNPGTRLDFRMKLSERTQFEGRYDKHSGAYVGVVFRIPF